MNKVDLITNILGILFSAVLSIVLANLGLDIYTAIFIGIILALLFVLLWLILKCQGLKKEIGVLNKKIIAQLEGFCPNDAKVDNLLLMALTQDIAEPLKISMLEKSAKENCNIISALILGNIYEYGIEKNGMILIEADREKAFELYKSIAKYDNYGVSHWMIGWYFQNNFVNEAKALSYEKRIEKAREYYEISKENGFPKALNSLGNFIIKGYADFDPEKDKVDMLTFYKKASEQGDNYAMLNYGHFFFREYFSCNKISSLEKAKEIYIKATDMKSPEAYVKLGIVYMEYYKIKDERKYLIEAQNNFLSSLIYGNNQFAAVGYYKLGYLVNEYSSALDITEIQKKISCKRFADLTIECYVKSYEIFLDLISKGKIISDENKKIFNLLSYSFKNIKE